MQPFQMRLLRHRAPALAPATRGRLGLGRDAPDIPRCQCAYTVGKSGRHVRARSSRGIVIRMNCLSGWPCLACALAPLFGCAPYDASLLAEGPGGSNIDGSGSGGNGGVTSRTGATPET